MKITTHSWIILSFMVILMGGCAQGKSGADYCGNGVCESHEDSFSCAQDCGSAGCGNAVIDTGEECDGSNLGGATCASLGYGSGTLGCLASCYYDNTGCTQSCSDQCELGQSRCTDQTIEVCATGASGCLEWLVGENCATSGSTCEMTDGVATCSESCSDLCEAGSSRCLSQVVQSCSMGSNGCLTWHDGTDCAATMEICQFDGTSAACVAQCTDVCSLAGETQCFGTVAQTCEMGVEGCLEWNDTQECALQGMVCSDGACACAQICQPDESRCTGDLLETCSAGGSGCYDWSVAQDCGATGLLCVDDGTPACDPSCTDACTAGTFQCSGDILEQCVLLGSGCLGWQTSQDCALSGQVCTAQSCQCDDACLSGALQCNGNIVEVCTANGYGCLEWTFQQDCASTGDTCLSGSCGVTFTGYTQSTFTGSYSSIASTTGVQNLGGPYDDAWGEFAIGSFNFYGTDYTSLWISSNGWISFGSDPLDAYPSNSSLPQSGSPTAAIYVFWDDHVIDTWYWTGAGLYLLVEGSAPARVITVEWKNTIHYDSTSWGDHRANFQVKLYEQTGVIELLYDRANWLGTIDWSGTVGIEENTLGDYTMAGSSFGTAPSSDIRFTPY